MTNLQKSTITNQNGGQCAHDLGINSQNVSNAKSLAELEKELKMLNRRRDKAKKSETIEKLELAIKELEEQIVLLKATPIEKARSSKATATFLPMILHDGSEVSMKLGRVKNNRFINQKVVDGFIPKIANGKYEKFCSIIVAKASKLIDKYALTDYEGNTINKDRVEDYYIVLDGQHRCKAFMQLNATGTEYKIPNVCVKEDVEDVGEYIVSINDVGQSWVKVHKVVIAALITEAEPFVSMAKLIGEGFNPSTPALIYTGKPINNNVLTNAIAGKPYKLNRNSKIDIERGNNFITTCKSIGMNPKLIPIRYFIGAFNTYAKVKSDAEAFESLANLKNLEDKETKFESVRHENDFIELLKSVESKKEYVENI